MAQPMFFTFPTLHSFKWLMYGVKNKKTENEPVIWMKFHGFVIISRKSHFMRGSAIHTRNWNAERKPTYLIINSNGYFNTGNAFRWKYFPPLSHSISGGLQYILKISSIHLHTDIYIPICFLLINYVIQHI